MGRPAGRHDNWWFRWLCRAGGRSRGNLIEVPKETHRADALALLADGRTALGLVDLVPMCAGERVLIEAAAGGVGSLLVQLAASAGATVVAAARGPRKADVAASLGATLSVDYSQPGWDDRVRAELGAVDVVFDGVGGEIGQTSFGLLADGGRFVSYGMASGTFAPIASAEVTRRRIEVLRPVRREPAELTALARRALDEAAAGRLRPLIGQTFPLDQAGLAHSAIGSRATIGKTLLVVRAAHDRPAS